jgi:hypothetical protein
MAIVGVNKRVKSKSDRRPRALHLTPLGDTSPAKFKRLAAEHERHVEEKIGKANRERLLDILADFTWPTLHPDCPSFGHMHPVERPRRLWAVPGTSPKQMIFRHYSCLASGAASVHNGTSLASKRMTTCREIFEHHGGRPA